MTKELFSMGSKVRDVIRDEAFAGFGRLFVSGRFGDTATDKFKRLRKLFYLV